MPEPKLRVLETGTQEWYLGGRPHREDGPAVTYTDGSEYWYLHGNLHRDGGPAISYAGGTKKWYRHGKQHRDGGPAAIFPDGRQEWFQNNERHREDGPAVIDVDGIPIAWYLYGLRQESNRDFQERLGLTDEAMTVLVLKYGNVR